MIMMSLPIFNIRLRTSYLDFRLLIPTSDLALSNSFYSLRTSDFRFSTSHFLFPTSDFKNLLLISDFQLPTSYYRVPTFDFLLQCPTSDFWLGPSFNFALETFYDICITQNLWNRKKQGAFEIRSVNPGLPYNWHDDLVLHPKMAHIGERKIWHLGC